MKTLWLTQTTLITECYALWEVTKSWKSASYDLALHLSSLFDGTSIRKGVKSSRLHLLDTFPSSELFVPSLVATYAIGGGHLLYSVVWLRTGPYTMFPVCLNIYLICIIIYLICVIIYFTISLIPRLSAIPVISLKWYLSSPASPLIISHHISRHFSLTIFLIICRIIFLIVL